MRGDGDGWVFDPDGSRYWGLHGAAGLLLYAPMGDGSRGVLLQHRAAWSHQGGTWGIPGGARDSHETPEDTALREADEETGISSEEVQVRAAVETHRAVSGWTYHTVIAEADDLLDTVANNESAELRWVPEHQVDDLPLHPAFAKAWPTLRDHLDR
ncbi:NUDIX hydrolase [Williamsia sp. CHRR-6]|uniref:NUDIX hydrolase n=1 Tax=Williamsia sp. CHRR-6 TaxID=2835871 RepID=UPI001BDB0BD3|nr:NUDIX hydrolase [Williamsia sp. CHRR-6]MBT0567048.1 NUDIX hydrolase [Williamsia sp. CHRR-6]